MTVATVLAGLIPVMWATGTGADVMKRIAAPMIGGIVTSFMLELLIYPAVYELWRWHFHVKKQPADADLAAHPARPRLPLPSATGSY